MPLTAGSTPWRAAFAREIGLDLASPSPPAWGASPAAALINPLQEGCPYPCKHLSGAGIAFKIAAALMERCGRPFPWEQLDLAALGTVADVVPLLQENRVLVALGLEEVRRSRRVGLKALMEACSLKPEQMESGALAFIIAPSLNAAGRMGEADPAVELLLEREEEKPGFWPRACGRKTRTGAPRSRRSWRRPWPWWRLAPRRRGRR